MGFDDLDDDFGMMSSMPPPRGNDRGEFGDASDGGGRGQPAMAGGRQAPWGPGGGGRQAGPPPTYRLDHRQRGARQASQGRGSSGSSGYIDDELDMGPEQGGYLQQPGRRGGSGSGDDDMFGGLDFDIMPVHGACLLQDVGPSQKLLRDEIGCLIQRPQPGFAVLLRSFSSNYLHLPNTWHAHSIHVCTALLRTLTMTWMPSTCLMRTSWALLVDLTTSAMAAWGGRPCGVEHLSNRGGAGEIVAVATNPMMLPHQEEGHQGGEAGKVRVAMVAGAAASGAITTTTEEEDGATLGVRKVGMADEAFTLRLSEQPQMSSFFTLSKF
eukprot:1140855-Pelagomonas_calceolata.AAC.8